MFVLLTLPVGAGRAEEPPRISIGLLRTFGQATHVLLSSDRAITLKEAASGRTIDQCAPGTVLEAVGGDEGMVLSRMPIDRTNPCEVYTEAVVMEPDGAGIVQAARIDSLADRAHPRWRRYRGSLTVQPNDDGVIRLIDTVALEEYLYSVVPPEIGADAPTEALKAQAVAARTYALRNRGKLAALGFDLDDTTRCQSYSGLDGEAAASSAAVDATRGEILTFNGVPIDSPYSTDCGGVTAVDRSGAEPYLQAVRDAPEGTQGPDYCSDSRRHTWTLELSSTEMERLLQRDSRTRVAGFGGLGIDGWDASGRIMTASVTGKDGGKKTVTGPQLREILGVDKLRSTRITVSRTASGGFVFKGSGWGHGFGMCQVGAITMAGPRYKKTYREILAHYYVGTEIVKN
jgi:stage II sporulation protein D